MKVLFDAQVFENQRIGGISRYFSALAAQLQNLGLAEPHFALKYSDNIYAPQLPGVNRPILSPPFQFRHFLGQCSFPGKQRLYTALVEAAPCLTQKDFNRNLARQGITSGEFDIFHPTYYNPYYMDCLGHHPLVVTFYDMIHEIYPEYFLINDSLSQWKFEVARRARAILCISENTKRDLLALFRVPEKKIHVVPLANSIISAPGPDPEGLPERFLLFVGSRWGYKNFYFCLRALQELFEADRSLNLVCTGDSFLFSETQFLKTLGLGERTHWFDADDAVLSRLYSRAMLLLFPSLYEGFGLPILEAFACGCPAVCSRAASLPEVGGDAVRYFNPKDAESIRQTVRRVLGAPQLRHEMREQGLARVQQFTWEKTARQTAAIYRAVMQSI